MTKHSASHLIKRGPVFWLQVYIPPAARPFLGGAKSIRQSLRTTSPAVANERKLAPLSNAKHQIRLVLAKAGKGDSGDGFTTFEIEALRLASAGATQSEIQKFLSEVPDDEAANAAYPQGPA